MAIYHFYHLYADGEFWKEAFDDHAEALMAANVPMQTTICILGSVENTRIAIDYVLRKGLLVSINPIEGQWEHPTLNLLAECAKKMNDDDLIFYAHTKGSVNKCDIHTRWRRIMERRCVIEWKTVMYVLENGYDTAGCYWITPEAYPNMPVKYPYYGGNYWWAKASHIKKLPTPVSLESRYEAEVWIGSVRPANPGVLEFGLPG